MMGVERLLELLRQRERERGPLIVFHGGGLPKTAPEVVERAIAANRTVVNIRFVASDGNGRPKEVLGHLGDSSTV